ncbi:hypothetical protein GCM10025778_34600 [Paeniglutamicibacter antarcticus]|uniref:Uncharacterized protein n=1 Tax=Paeniglutamicibacter antarcticus TaxID=494023 RepID=A0ABP9TQE6_9MICC
MRADAEPLLRDPPGQPIPSYAAHVVPKEFLATDEPRRGFTQLSEGAALHIVPAAFVRQGTEAVQNSWG